MIRKYLVYYIWFIIFGLLYLVYYIWFIIMSNKPKNFTIVNADDEYSTNKPWYTKRTFGYIILIVLYLSLSIIHLLTHLEIINSHSESIIQIVLYFTAAGAYLMMLYGHWREKDVAIEKIRSVVRDLESKKN